MSRDVSNTEDIVDSRNIENRIDELEELETAVTEARTALEQASADIDDEDREELESALESAESDFDDDSRDELKILRDLRDDVSSSEWRHGVTLIRRSYWVEYCEDFCKDIGDIPEEIPSYIEIDWDKTADNLEADYSTTDWDGIEYLYRG
jgi:hypothetical protein